MSGKHQMADDEIEEVVCPRCFANTGEPCETPTGEFAVATHVARRRKAESILDDLATLSYLPELGPETGSAPGTAGGDQPAQDEDTSPEPAVARGRLHAQVPLEERRGDHGEGHDDGDDHAAEAAGGGPPGKQLVELAGEGQEDEHDDVGEIDCGHRPYGAAGVMAVIPGGAPLASRGTR
jgi:hypothetical protein